MKIGFLCKRHYTGHDVIADRFGRLYEIPRQLAMLGHDVRGYCLDYHHARGDGQWAHDMPIGSLAWESRSLGRLRLSALADYPMRLPQHLRRFSPDILIGASDIPHIALVAWLSRKLGIPYVVDLYDNFESFGQARIPGFIGLLKRSVRDADLVIAVSDPLKRKVEREYGVKGKVLTMPNGVDRSLFHPTDPARARARLGLPIDAELVGTAGGLTREKGLEVLYAAWTSLERLRPKAHLVLAGPVDDDLPPPRGMRVHYLGQLPHVHIADLFNSLNVGVITALDSPFGRYCFPQKAYEMLACGLPVVASDTGVMSELLADRPQFLYPADDAEALAEAICRQLDQPLRIELPIYDWQELRSAIETEILGIVRLYDMPNR